jgi:hypothetical protein
VTMRHELRGLAGRAFVEDLAHASSKTKGCASN